MNKILVSVLVITAFLLGASYVYMQKSVNSAAASDQNSVSEIRAVFSVSAGVISGPELVSAKQGDRIALTFISDVPDEIHVHGYDIAEPLKPGETTYVRFIADVAGRFEIELHGAHKTLTALEIKPSTY